MNENVKTLAKVNNQSIVVIENGEKRVPIRPICDALGISYQGQIDKLKDDEILNSTLRLSLSQNGREMQTIPYKFVFGWLFTINPKNVNPEAQEIVRKYKMECYEVLYRHFTDHSEFLEQKQTAIEGKLKEVEEIQLDFRTTKDRLSTAKKQLTDIRNLTFEDWQTNNRQMKLVFPETETINEQEER